MLESICKKIVQLPNVVIVLFVCIYLMLLLCCCAQLPNVVIVLLLRQMKYFTEINKVKICKREDQSLTVLAKTSK